MTLEALVAIVTVPSPVITAGQRAPLGAAGRTPAWPPASWQLTRSAVVRVTVTARPPDVTRSQRSGGSPRPGGLWSGADAGRVADAAGVQILTVPSGDPLATRGAPSGERRVTRLVTSSSCPVRSGPVGPSAARPQ